LTEPTARSFAELSLKARRERRWPSLYEAFEDGRIDRNRLQQVFVEHLPSLPAGQRLRWAIDASGIARPQSPTSADRTALHVPNLPQSRTPPITVGWQFSTRVVVPPQPSSWWDVLDSRRIPSSQTAGEVAVEHLREVVARLPEGVHPLLIADRYYPSAPFLRASGPLPIDKLLRCKKNRLFSRAAPAPTGKRGARRKEGDRFACHQQSTHGEPDERWEGTDESEHPLLGERWNHLQLKQAREVELCVLRVTRLGDQGKESRRKPRVSWFIEQGPRRLSLSEVRPSYQCRYGIEHSYRFEKQQVLWEQARLRTPEQFERWTQIVAIVQNHLVLARPFVQAARQPWERTQRAVTPQQVRRGLAAFLPLLGTPARPPQPRGKAPGRSLHALITPAPRYPVVKKARPKPKKRRKAA
jgi:DDE superfamily endonuclease